MAGASSLLNAATSENARQPMRLRNMGDVWSVGMVNEEVKQHTERAIDLSLGRER